MKFEEMLSELKKRKKAKNMEWNGLATRNMHIRIQFPDENSMITHPYLVMHIDQKIVPWFPSREDLFSEEWAIID